MTIALVVMTAEGEAMNLQIRDRRAHELASRLAAKRKTSMTQAVITALENELRRTDAVSLHGADRGDRG